MRISCAPFSWLSPSKEQQNVYNKIVKRRGPLGLLPLDRALLHSLPVAESWHCFFGTLNTKISLPADLRTIAICRVALICRANVQWNGHIPTLKTLVNHEQLRAISTRDLTAQGALSDVQWAVLRYADAMTTDLQVEDAIFVGLKDAGLSEQAIVELTATVAMYNGVSRFLIALEVDEKSR